jgi:hypothetical protein
MGYVVKVSGHGPADPQWIGHNTPLDPKRLVSRNEARVFPSESEAMWEIRKFRALLPDGTQFKIETDPG